MKLKDFDYNLPKELIAQEPMKPRDHSRLFIIRRLTQIEDRFNAPLRPASLRDYAGQADNKFEHKHFYNIVGYLKKGDVLVLNNSKVFPARLIGKKAETGGKIEVFLLKSTTPSSAKATAGKPGHSLKRRGEKIELWKCLVGGKIGKVGQIVEFSKNFQAEILKDNQDGTWEVKFNLVGKKFWQAVEKCGQMPLPPYIKSKSKVKGQKSKVFDAKNYQTIFADEKKLGSVAAPTAGFHFTKPLLAKLKKKGVQIEYVALHVGLGTFAPVKADDIKKHKMHSEFVEMSEKTLRNVLQAKMEGRRIIAVGTTSVRTLEAAFQNKKAQKQKSTKTNSNICFWTDIFIFPGYKFKMADAMITNFHLPKSTLLMLVSAFAGRKNILRAYQEAIKKKYRFFSYGDAMLIY
jgi:S-adenosylmethionine:tRNA ribosyltransferase-isomerase